MSSTSRRTPTIAVALERHPGHRPGEPVVAVHDLQILGAHEQADRASPVPVGRTDGYGLSSTSTASLPTRRRQLFIEPEVATNAVDGVHLGRSSQLLEALRHHADASLIPNASSWSVTNRG